MSRLINITKMVVLGFIIMLMISSAAGANKVTMGYGWSINPDEAQAAREAVAMMKESVANPDFLVVFTESSYENNEVIVHNLSRLLNKPKIFGLEGSYAVFTRDGIHVGKKGALAILGFEAPSWNIGVGAEDMSKVGSSIQIKDKALSVIKKAVEDAEMTTEDKPSLVFVAPTKLKEEPILEAIEYMFGEDIRISGGTPGGSDVFANDEVVNNGFALAVIYANSNIGAGFHAGIAIDRNKSGIVTKMGESRRIIKEINDKPAFEQYRQWAGGALDDLIPAESPYIWARPFALVRVYNLVENEVGTKVVVPTKVNPDLSMVTGADISEGEQLYFANTTKKAYIKRAGTIVRQAMLEGKIKYPELAGGVHFYCRGAAFSQFGKNKDNLQSLVVETNSKIREKPYIGTFTAGEQGNISGYGIFMGNLTSSMAVFSK